MSINLDRFFNHRPTTEIAKNLLGKRFSYHGTSAWITETEAYVGAKDKAAHGYQDHKANWNRALFMAPGTIYIFTMYGSNLLNFITQPTGNPQGVLIRGVQPAGGVKLMQKRRHKISFNLTNGPGKLCTAMGIDLSLNTKVLNRSDMTIDLTDHAKQPKHIATSGRIGVPHKGRWTTAPLRYYVAGNPFVSKLRKRDMDLKNYGWK